MWLTALFVLMQWPDHCDKNDASVLNMRCIPFCGCVLCLCAGWCAIISSDLLDIIRCLSCPSCEVRLLCGTDAAVILLFIICVKGRLFTNTNLMQRIIMAYTLISCRSLFKQKKKVSVR